MKYYYIAAAYGEGNYNTDMYGGAAQTSPGTPTTTTSQTPGTTNPTDNTGSATGAGVLANTGIEVLVAVTLACLIIFIALIVRFWRRKPVPVAVAAADKTTDIGPAVR